MTAAQERGRRKKAGASRPQGQRHGRGLSQQVTVPTTEERSSHPSAVVDSCYPTVPLRYAQAHDIAIALIYKAKLCVSLSTNRPCADKGESGLAPHSAAGFRTWSRLQGVYLGALGDRDARSSTSMR